MGFWNFLLPPQKLDQALLDQVNALGMEGEINGDGTMTITAPDGREFMISGEKEVNIRFRQVKPYKVLFQYGVKGHFVNDPQPEGYRALIDRLKNARGSGGRQNAVLTFLLERYGNAQ